MEKKKKIILIVLISIITIALIAGGVFAYLYFATDLFKSNKKMFLTNISKNSELVEYFKKEDLLKLYAEKQKNTPYNVEGTIKASGVLALNPNLKNSSVTISGSSDNINNYVYRNIKLNYSDTESIGVEYLNDETYYGLRFKDVLEEYIAFQNKNLKEFFNKMGLGEEIQIPDSIDFSNYNMTKIFSDEELNSIKERYGYIILNNLTDDMFTKSESNGEIVYTLTITEQTASEILYKIMEELKNDTLILNKVKEIMINKANLSESDATNYIITLQDGIQKTLDNLKEEIKNLSNNQIEKRDDDRIFINLYVSGANLTKTEIKYLEDKVSLSKGENGYLIEVNVNNSVFAININKTCTDDIVKYEVSAKQDNSELFKLVINLSGLKTLESVKEEFEFNVKIEGFTAGYTYNGTRKFASSINKEHITSDNTILINTAPSMDKIQNLLTQVAQGINITNENKKQLAGISTYEQEPISLYAPAIIPFVGLEILNGSIDLPTSAFLSGVGVAGGAMYSIYNVKENDKDIMQKAEDAMINTNLSSFKEQVNLASISAKTTIVSNMTTSDIYTGEYKVTDPENMKNLVINMATDLKISSDIINNQSTINTDGFSLKYFLEGDDGYIVIWYTDSSLKNINVYEDAFNANGFVNVPSKLNSSGVENNEQTVLAAVIHAKGYTLDAPEFYVTRVFDADNDIKASKFEQTIFNK